MNRLSKRFKFEDNNAIIDGLPTRRKRIVDLGSADGSSSIETLHYAIKTLNDNGGSASSPIPIHLTFEEHPSSNKEKLQHTLDMHDDWFKANNIRRDILMKSFYQPLFPKESVDFMMSYICLHWLDSTDVKKSILEWKSIGSSNSGSDDSSLSEWTQINETTVPAHAKEEWRTRLADKHLARFLSLRSLEMRPGAELLLVMVGHPHEFLTPADGGAGPLTRAMKQCISRGELREEVLRHTIIPYYLRTPEDIKSALEVAKTIEIDNERPGALLQLIDCKSISTITRGDEDDTILQGAFDLMWSIHSHSIEHAEPTSKELECIKTAMRSMFNELYDKKVGMPGSFVACTLRRRTREPQV
jgi:hypothetical protein